MKPEIVVFGLSLKTFGLCFGAAFVVSGAMTARRLRELGRPPDWAYEMVFAALIGGLVGARGYWLLGAPLARSPATCSAASSEAPGSTWYGGLAGGAVGVLLWAWRKGMLNLELLDMNAPSLAMGYAIGRIGCQVSGDGDYGKATERPVGDGVSARDRADERGRAPDADLRDARDGPRRVAAVAPARRVPAGRAVRVLPRARRRRALPRRVPAPQPPGRWPGSPRRRSRASSSWSRVSCGWSAHRAAGGLRVDGAAPSAQPAAA